MVNEDPIRDSAEKALGVLLRLAVVAEEEQFENLVTQADMIASSLPEETVARIRAEIEVSPGRSLECIYQSQLANLAK